MAAMAIIAIIIAKAKSYKVIPIFKELTLYPFYFFEVVFIILQINVLFGNYAVLRYAPYIKNMFLLSLLVPIIRYKLYKPGLAGSALVIFGTLLNKIVILANGNKMPVYPSLSYITGYVTKDAFMNSNTHVLGDSLTKVKILSDYIDVGYSILSVGDIFIHSFTIIIFYYVIKELNIKSLINNNCKGGSLKCGTV